MWRQFDEAFHGDMATLIHIDPDQVQELIHTLMHSPTPSNTQPNTLQQPLIYPSTPSTTQPYTPSTTRPYTPSTHPLQDFIENINHMQLHRRVKAFGKLRTFLVTCATVATATAAATSASTTEGVMSAGAASSSNNNNNNNSSSSSSNNNNSNSSDWTCPLSLPTLVHVLLPLALHPLTSEEFKKKDHLTLLQESAAFIGAIALHLPWSSYLGIIKTLLKQLDRQKTEKEKVLLTALCAVLDAFHFDLTADEEAVGGWVDLDPYLSYS